MKRKTKRPAIFDYLLLVGHRSSSRFPPCWKKSISNKACPYLFFILFFLILYFSWLFLLFLGCIYGYVVVLTILYWSEHRTLGKWPHPRDLLSLVDDLSLPLKCNQETEKQKNKLKQKETFCVIKFYNVRRFIIFLYFLMWRLIDLLSWQWCFVTLETGVIEMVRWLDTSWFSVFTSIKKHNKVVKMLTNCYDDLGDIL